MNFGRLIHNRSRLSLTCVWFFMVMISPITYYIWGANTDTSWLITVIERMYNGDVLYRDIFETNPPFSIWLYKPPVLFALAFGLSPELAVHYYAALAALLGVGLTAWILSAGQLLANRSIAIVATLSLVIAIFLSGNVFTEREYFGAVLMTPILALVAWRAGGASAPYPIHWITAGLAASILPMIKPHYIPVLVSVAVLYAYQTRSIRNFFLPEFILAGVVFSIYIVVAYMVYPDFFSVFMPLLREIYTSAGRPLFDLTKIAIRGLTLTFMWFFVFSYTKRSKLSIYTIAAAIVAWIPFFWLGKGWPYHTYPAVYFSCLAILLALAEYYEKIGWHQVLKNNRQIAAIIGFAIVVGNGNFYRIDRHSNQFIEEINAQVSNPTIGMLGEDIASAHPLSRQLGGQWVEPYCSDWLPAYALNRAYEMNVQNAPELVAHYQDMANIYFAEKIKRFAANHPELLIVKSKSLLIKFMLENHEFKSFMRDYSLIASEKNIDVYLKNGSGSKIKGAPPVAESN